MSESQYDQVTVLDNTRVEIFPVGPDGLIQEDLDELAQLIPKMKSGALDAVSLVPMHGVFVTAEIRDLVEEQLERTIEKADLKGTPSITRAGGGYTFLHVDKFQDVDGELIQEPGVRTHFTEGSSTREGNVPSGYKVSDFDPYFVIGRSPAADQISHERLLPFNSFEPVVAIDVQSPIWTIFRNTGDLNGPNPPLAHCVVPKKVLDAILHPAVRWSGIDEQGRQSVTVGEEKITINNDNYAMIAGVDSPIKSPDRQFTARDYIDRNVNRQSL